MLNNKLKNFLIFISKIIGLLSLIFTLCFIIFFQSTNNPDWDSYGQLYNKADIYLPLWNGGEILYPRSNYIFILLMGFLNNFITYEEFRTILVISQLFFYFIIFKQIKFKILDLNFLTSSILISFLLLKVHIQIREGISLLLYFYYFLNINNEKLFSPKKILLSLSSLLIHPGSLILWIPSIIAITKEKFLEFKKIWIYIVFFLLALFSVSTYFRLLIGNYLPYLSSENLTFQQYIDRYSIEFDFQKIIYWFSYLILFIFIYIEELKINSIALYKKTINQSKYLLGYVSLHGLIVFLPTILIASIFFNINSLDYNLIFRITSILIFFLCFYRILVYPKRILTLILNAFFSLDILRIIF